MTYPYEIEYCEGRRFFKWRVVRIDRPTTIIMSHFMSYDGAKKWIRRNLWRRVRCQLTMATRSVRKSPN